MGRQGRTVLRGAVALGVAVPAVALALQPAQAGNGDGGGAVVAVDDLRDLQPGRVDPLDGATAGLTVVRHDGSTSFTFRLQHVQKTASERVFGAHLHVGPCVAGDGGAAKAHYNTDSLAGDTTPEISRDTEVWLDFQVNAGGSGHAFATVPFEIQPGQRSVVVHALPTAPNGTAGDRLACLPVVVR
ncbi:hypothetical protein [Nocardioides iriomotensis]|uniref:Superoxide dismutase family protein n=1 Tax=Nocardioides iriomotensis TaxID=715784 RepID=A0A4Q5J205_9ACTN|nr:hypothetical protein [Nocardioides iriomotensis]RYU12393.1 hypothetical protein ETU37_10340 [Nocardioides iriomotensis]